MIFLVIFWVIINTLLIFNIFMFIRICWVWRARMNVLNDPTKNVAQCLQEYHQLPTYEQMLSRFWVWDIRKFMLEN